MIPIPADVLARLVRLVRCYDVANPDANIVTRALIEAGVKR